ncbi:MAG: ABC transporter permease [Planctomycetaceae bacterium]|jgi:putative ABC transport system permease protein|nr:ABC transporter permease [Planctomycetaceae bacterium]MBT6154699.1 ABC transporter permease [Planctomycetaceae bacterium]MBT6485901.1 ABC transporter permease [Planctomycetaceae bacterium]MBT6493473.1 ABC transporter permease [Planctomycetaceae bacterium]
MTTTRLLLQSILCYWRTNLAVLLGVIAGTAVIGGALIVGDSVRGSLRQMTEERLGKIDHVLNSPRFFRQELAGELAAHPEFAKQFDTVAPALVMTGALEYQKESDAGDEAESALILRAGKVSIFGVEETLWDMTDHGEVPRPEDGEIILSRRLADQLQKKDSDGNVQTDKNGKPLGVEVGETVSVWVEVPSSIPRDSLLGKRDETSREITLTVKAILDDALGVGRLNLNPNQQLPMNAFMSLDTLQRALDLNQTRDRKTRTVTPARVNTLFVAAKSKADREGDKAPAAANRLTHLLTERWTLADLELRVAANEKRQYLSLESEQQILSVEFAAAGRRTAERLDLQHASSLVYLANKIAGSKESAKFSRYSIVAGLDMAEPPDFDAFTFAAGGPPTDKEIVLDSWLADDLGVHIGDDVNLWYYEVGNHGDLPEQKRTFKLSGIVEMTGSAIDSGLTPSVKGITDVETFDEWDAPFTMKKVTDRDDDFWDEYRATPKAFVTLSTAQTLWRSRYGQLTSVRVSPPKAESLEESAEIYSREVLNTIDPNEIGMAFDAVKQRQLAAASGTTDFAVYFIAFSFFLIASATILIGLLFRLGIERRSTNVGLLGAVGFAPRRVNRLFLTEGLIVVGSGAGLGLLAAYGYAWMMVYGLKTWWFGAIGTKFLFVHVTPLSLLIGFVGSVVVAAVAIWWAMRQLRALSNRELLSGAVETSLTGEARLQRGRKASIIALSCSVIAAVMLIAAASIPQLSEREAFGGFSWQVVSFFLVGVLLLTASLTFLSAWLDSDRSTAVRGSGAIGMGRLGIRNAARHRQRSVLTTGLIASATFVIVAIAAGHRNPAVEQPKMNSGNGGFTLVAETSQPIYEDLNDEQARKTRALDFDKTVGDQSAISRAERNNRLLAEMEVFPFHVKPGENASCLNIYQTHLPTVLGVPQRMIERGGFKFSGAKQDNPWTLLEERLEDETVNTKQSIPIYPVLADMNTLQYSLHKGVGSTIDVPDDENPEYKLKIVGQFDGSVFQGVLLMSDENFRRLYSDRKGFEYFLIEVPVADADDLSSILETGLNDFGFDAEPVAKRLDDFLSVQNTYLSTFQTLGGLGLLLGTLGLATVMLRNVFERRAELALLRAVGFRNGHLAWLVLWENAFLLTWGLLAGTASALLAMTPHLLSIGADVPWTSVITILAGVFVVGMIAAFIAVAEAVSTPILATLRSE